MVSVLVSDNFSSAYGHWNTEGNGLKCEYPSKAYGIAKHSNSMNVFSSSSKVKIGVHIDGREFKCLPDSALLSFKSEQAQIPDDELILSIQQLQRPDGIPGWRVQSGNYVGNIQFQQHKIELRSRFSDAFLQRMMSVVSGVYLSEARGRDEAPTNYAEFILHYLFVQKLEKAFLLGFPRAYRSQKHHESSLKGRVDIPRLIRQDMPFKGKISSIRRERLVDEEIITLLYQALKIIHKSNKTIAKNILHVHQALLQFNLGPLRKDSICKAKSSIALNNPIFAPYREVISLAELIINNESLKQSFDSSRSSYGFLVNVAELFEIYVSNILAKNLPEWSIESPSILLYKKQFFERKIIPDIVMRKDNRVVVFDTKYKRMEYIGKNSFGMGDVDRIDFFQIHTYMSYYQAQKDIEFIGGGLIYPFILPYPEPVDQQGSSTLCFSDTLLGGGTAWFCIDGVVIPEVFEKDDTNDKGLIFIEKMERNELNFIKRVKKYLE